MNYYEELVNLNKQNKETVKERVLNIENEDNKHLWDKMHCTYLRKSGPHFMLCELNKCIDRNLFEYHYVNIGHIGAIRKYLNEGFYIRNISLLKKEEDILNKYYLSRTDIARFYRHISNAKVVNIIKVDNIDNYLAKTTLLNKHIIVERFNYYSFIIDNNTVTLLSDLNICVDKNEPITFMDCEKLNKVYISNLILGDKKVGYVTSLKGFFHNCIGLETINLNNFNTKYVTDFTGMFENCTKLKNINIEAIDTSSAITLMCMFCNCRSLELLNLNNFKVNNVTNFAHMFSGCSTIRRIELDKWVFCKDKELNLLRMFFMASNLRELDLSKFSKVLRENKSYIKEIFSFTPFDGYL